MDDLHVLTDSVDRSRSGGARARTRTYLLLASGVWVVAGMLGLVVAAFSCMLFDAPGSENNPATVAVFFTLVSFPIVCAAAIAISWTLYSLRLHLAACMISLLPLVDILAVIAAIVCSSVFYGGRLN